jgi:tRNA G18 (ribose-2'-O)-methylase SpoU
MKDEVDSLNLAVATSILLYEVFNQKSKVDGMSVLLNGS